jgi:hypothetical protein
MKIIKTTYSSLQALFVTFLSRDIGGSIGVEITGEYDQVVDSALGCLLFNILACRFYL